MNLEQLCQDYQRIEEAIAFLDRHFLRQPSLEEVARSVNLSEFHFQRLFSRWAGISPKRFLQYLTKEYARTLLESSRSTLEVAYEAGLSGPGRLHDLFLSCEAVTPGEYKSRGEGIRIRYAFHPSPFGRCMLAVTDRGICGLRFVREGTEEELAGRLRERWKNAAIEHAPHRVGPVAERVFDFSATRDAAPLHLHVRGTNFQIKVWEALLRIPAGKAVSYEELARHIGTPGAARAVGNAVGSNAIPFLIPCHRVIRKLGDFGNYGEGPIRKKIMLGWEAARIETAQGAR